MLLYVVYGFNSQLTILIFIRNKNVLSVIFFEGDTEMFWPRVIKFQLKVSYVHYQGECGIRQNLCGLFLTHWTTFMNSGSYNPLYVFIKGASKTVLWSLLPLMGNSVEVAKELSTEEDCEIFLGVTSFSCSFTYINVTFVCGSHAWTQFGNRHGTIINKFKLNLSYKFAATKSFWRCE